MSPGGADAGALARRALRVAGATLRAHRPLVVVLAFGLLLRIALLIVYYPVAGGFNDSVAYLGLSYSGVFSDGFKAAGYPLYLIVLRWIWEDLTFTVVVQHLLGLGTAILLYAIVYRVTRSRWLGLVPAGITAVNGDLLFLEHSLLTEAPYTFLVCLGVCCAVFAADGARRPGLLLALGGLSLGIAWTMRSVAIAAAVVGVVWLVWTQGPTWRRRLGRAAALGSPFAAVVVLYVVLQGSMTGFWGLSPGVGWALYMRVAPVADCTEFTPPAGTEFLCETTPPYHPDPNVARPGPGYYQYVAGPAIERFGNPFATRAAGDDVVGEFAKAVIVHQPIAYLREAGRDVLRIVWPLAGYDRPYSGVALGELDIARRAPGLEETTIAEARKVGYATGDFDLDPGVGALQDFQSMTHVEGPALLTLLALAIVAVSAGRGRVRRVAWLAGLIAVAQAVIPPLTIAAGIRYSLPSLGLIATAAALGVHAVLPRSREAGAEAGP